MRKQLLLLFTLLTGFVACAQTFTTGHLIYANRYNYSAGEMTILTFNGASMYLPVDSINNRSIKTLLFIAGINKDSIITTLGYGSSSSNIVEVYFAFKGTLSPKNMDVALENPKHRFAAYASPNGIIAPYFNYLDKTVLRSSIDTLYQNYKVNSFMVRNFVIDSLPTRVISKSPSNGNLADMRNIPNSYVYVDTFKALNWAVIWYMDAAGKQKGLLRPKNGW